MSLNKNKNVNSQHVNINNISENNTKKELLDVLSKLKKTEIVSMINHYNNNNKKANSRNSNKNVNSRNSNKNVKVQNTGMNSRMNTRMNTGMNTGMNSRMNTGMNTGMNSRMNTGMNSRMNSRMNTGMNTGINITKKKITVPNNLNSLELKPTAPDNDQYNGV
jgi:hypothetical protein